MNGPTTQAQTLSLCLQNTTGSRFLMFNPPSPALRVFPFAPFFSCFPRHFISFLYPYFLFLNTHFLHFLHFLHFPDFLIEHFATPFHPFHEFLTYSLFFPMASDNSTRLFTLSFEGIYRNSWKKNTTLMTC